MSHIQSVDFWKPIGTIRTPSKRTPMSRMVGMVGMVAAMAVFATLITFGAQLEFAQASEMVGVADVGP